MMGHGGAIRFRVRAEFPSVRAMTLTLLLLRHSKAKRDSPDGEDASRALSGRGRDAADLIAGALGKVRLAPDLALVSSARRTSETWGRIAAAHGWAGRERLDDRLYLAGAARILRLVRAVKGRAKTVMVVGHNPGLADLGAMLAGAGDRTALADLRAGFPTGALAVITFDAPRWRDVARGKGRLVRFVKPREIH
jgi:phosphohistidine phosphatase